MVNEKMKIKYKKAAGNTVTSLVISLLIGMSVLIALYGYWGSIAEDSGQTISSEYTDVASNVSGMEGAINGNITDIVNAWDSIVQADNAAFAVWNSFTGLGIILKKPFIFLQITIDFLQIAFAPLSILPDWTIGFGLIGVTTYIIFLLLKVLKGEPSL